MKKAIPPIVTFSTPVAAEHSAPDPAKLIAGRPVHTTHNHYVDAGQRFFSGIWSSTEGKWRVSYAEHEFCALLDGHVRLVSDDGARTELRAGDSFVIPAGFSGTWETVVACRKLYVIYAPPDEAAKPKPRRAVQPRRTQRARGTRRSR